MSKRVLIVEDDRQLCEEMKEFLENYDFRVFYAVTPEEGRQMLKDSSCDFLLIDYRLPDQDGISFLEEIKDSIAGAKVFFITASLAVSMMLEERKLAYRVAGIFKKPFDGDYLLETLQRQANLTEEGKAHENAIGQDT